MKLWRDIKDFVLSFYYPKGQNFLVSFPKTGRTWLIYMLNQIKDLSNHPLKESKSFIFNEHDNSEIIIENGYKTTLWIFLGIPIDLDTEDLKYFSCKRS